MTAKKLTVLVFGLVIALSSFGALKSAGAQSATQAATEAAAPGIGKIVYIDVALQGKNNYGYTILDPVSKAATPVKLSSALLLSSLSLSPDGKMVAFLASNAKGDQTPNIYVANVNGSGMKQLTRDAKGGVVPSNGAPGWSPDSKQLLFIHNEIIGSGNGPQLKLSQLMVAGADGKLRPQKFPTESAVGFPPYSAAPLSAPSWPSAGRRMLLVGEQTDTVKVNDQTVVLLVMDLDGKNIAPFTQNGVYPAWSPDGSRAAIVANQGHSIVVTDAEGAVLLEIKSDQISSILNVAWSPDGKQLAFGGTDSTNETGHIYTIGADGSNAQILVDTGDATSLLSWADVPDAALAVKGTPTIKP